ncbi:MAG: group 1 truncated hemoglobin [Candidatus Rokuibacteriota bacterium]
MRRTTAWSGLLLFVMTLALGACASMRAPAEPSLYKRLGGREGIRGVVDDFVAALVADPRVNARFNTLKPADVERVKTNISDQVCEVTGGPCSYLGKDMKTAHKGMRITEAEWNAGVEDLVKALDKRKVPEKDKKELLGLLTPMKNDIVNQ